MSNIGYLQGLGARHLLTLNNEGTSTADDYGNSVDPTRITSTDNYSFVTDPVCYGFTHCLRSTTSTTNLDAARIDNRNDINGSNGSGNDSSSHDYNSGTYGVLLWSRQSEIYNPTTIYEQGGSINNFAFMGGAQTTAQGADSGQPFLIEAGKSLAQAGRSKLLFMQWRHHSQHAGSGNILEFYENGVLQGIASDTGTASFPGHSGDITIGNSADALQSFAGTTFVSQSVSKDANLWVTFNNSVVTEAQIRELFERMVLPEVLIDADTVVNQQAALDALSGTTYSDVNCAIEIRQATDATDYTLTLNNIQFVQNEFLRDIAVKYVGTNTLTLVNSGGSNAVEVATPAEQELSNGAILAGGGSIAISNPATLTITDLTIGNEVRIYDYPDATSANFGTELAGVEDVTSTTFDFEHALGGDQVLLQVIGTSEGFEERNLTFTLLSTDQQIPAGLITEENT